MDSTTTTPATKADQAPTAQTVRLLRGVTALVERAVARALEPHGLTIAQFEVLKVMGTAHDESLGCSELGKRLAGPSSDVTRLLDRLESVALVSRERDSQDRRAVHTKITEKGRELLAAAGPDVTRAESQALAALAGPEQRHLTRLLADLQGSLDPS